jgi:dephospho-CoA kinase
VSTARSRTQSKTAAKRPYLLIGVTGGIGSGKTKVCREFGRLGRFVLSADDIARDLTATQEVLSEIRTEFGDLALTSRGDLDRKAVASLVFHSRKARQRLNAIIHPKVFERVDEILSAQPPMKLSPYALVEAALIFESGMNERLDYVVVVDAPEEERIRRTMERDGCSRDEVLARIAAQMSVDQKRNRADFIIENTGGLGELRSRVIFFDLLWATMTPRPDS